MSRISNPPNRFDPRTIEWEEAPPRATLTVVEDDTQEVLARNDGPDVDFEWSVNPYRRYRRLGFEPSPPPPDPSPFRRPERGRQLRLFPG